MITMRHTLPVLLSLSMLFCGPLRAQALDAIVVVAGEDVILESELDTALRQIEAQMREQNREVPERDLLRRQVLDRLLLVKLQLQRAKAASIEVSEEDLQQALGSMAQRNNMTVNEFAEAVTRDGLDYAHLREQVRNELLITRLRQREVESRITVTEEDVDLFLEAQGGKSGTEKEYRLSHILIETEEGAADDATQKARQRADALLKELRAGGDFASQAMAYSSDPQALTGGDLGWRTAASLPSMFAKVAPRMKPGDISDVITSPSGFHLIKLEEVRNAAAPATGNAQLEVNARHILLQPNAVRDDAASKALAEKLHKQLVDGGDFAALAREHSDDAGSKNRGGELGWQSPANYVKEFRENVEAMKPDEIRGPFATRFGWHILQLIGRRERAEGGDDLRDKARNAIFQRKAAEEYEVWLRRLRDEAYVEYRLPETKGG
jgi:peptidyl-prolyl cis-trans isomerase SurA